MFISKYSEENSIFVDRCYCVSEDGERIFGEDIYSQSADLLMNCSE